MPNIFVGYIKTDIKPSVISLFHLLKSRQNMWTFNGPVFEWLGLKLLLFLSDYNEPVTPESMY